MKRFILTAIIALTVAFSYAQNNSAWDWTSISGTSTNAPGKSLKDIFTDASGNVYTTGTFMGSMTIGGNIVATSGDGTVSSNFDQDAFIAKYDASGNIEWLKKFGINSLGSNQIGNVITVDAAGNVYVGGSGMSIYTTNSSFLVKYDASGNLLWSKTDLPLYEISGINISPDGNLIVMETGQGPKNIYKINNTTGAIMWTVTNVGAGTNGGSKYDDFVDAAGNIYYNAFTTAAGSPTINGQAYPVTDALNTFIVSLDNNGATRWVQLIKNVQVQLGYTIDAAGNSYIQIGGGFGGSFQGISTASVGGSRYFELDNAGIVKRNLFQSPYVGLFRVKSDGIYGYQSIQFTTVGSQTVAYGDYYYRTNSATPTKAYGVVVKYNQTNDQVIWANGFEMTGLTNNAGTFNNIEISTTGKVVVGGYIYAAVKTGTTTYTPTLGPGNNQTDFFVAQFNGNTVSAPATTTWTGTANNGSWTDASNWSNGIPTGNEKTIIPAALSSYPQNITAANATGKLEIGMGVNLALPVAYVAPGGIVNSGNIEVIGTGTFQGFNSTATPYSGTGKLIFTANSPTDLLYSFPGSLEINKPGGTINSYGGTIGGSLFLTSGKLTNFGEISLTDPNATVTSSTAGYITSGTLKRAVNASGNYVFPIGTTTNYTPVTLNLNSISGPTNFSVTFATSSSGSTPNISFPTSTVNTLLNNNVWKVTPNATLTAGTYDVNLTARGYTNGVTDATRFVAIKRENSAAPWMFEGTNGTSTQSGETVNSGVTSNGVINVFATGLSTFSDFGIGIGTTSVAASTAVFTTTWTGTAADKTWNTVSNWNNGVPNGLANVIIPAGLATYPEIFSGTESAEKVSIANGATVKFPYNLKINGPITNNGSIEVTGNTGNTFAGFGTNTTSGYSPLAGTGKLVFTAAGPNGISGTLNNNIEVNRTLGTLFNINANVGGSLNFLSGDVYSSSSTYLTMTNAASTITIATAVNHLQGALTRTINSTGTYNFPIGNQYGSGVKLYEPISITTNNVVGTQNYKADFYYFTSGTTPKLLVDDVPVTTSLDFGTSYFGKWTIVPNVAATAGTINITFEARNYTNGVADVNRYVLLRRANNSSAWENVANATITENSGLITAAINNLPALTASAEFAIGIKGSIATWNGSVSNNYATAANWTPNGVPTTTTKTIFVSGSPNYPSTFNASGAVEISSGLTISLPQTENAAAGIVNNGTIIVTGTSSFSGFNTGSTAISGTGKLVFNASGPSSISAIEINNGIEINRSAGIALGNNLIVGGSITLTSGLVTGNYSVTMSNPNATISYNETSYLANTSLIRNVNASGTYQFPIGTTTRFAPAVLQLNSISGPTKITSTFATAAAGSIQPNTVVGGKGVARILNTGTWTLTPDVALTAGSYDVKLEGRGYNNGSTNAANYVVLKRQNSSFNYQFFGTSVTSTETAGVITATATGISGFSDFSIGVALDYETKWTGTAADKKWITAGNWDNGVPSSVQKAVFDNTGTNFPEIFTGMSNNIDKVEVGTGISVRVPIALSPTNGIVNNGTMIPIGSYYSGNLPTGTGKMLFNDLGPSTVSISTNNTLNQNVEIDRPTGISFSSNVNGNFKVISGVVAGTITITNPNAIMTFAAGTYINGSLTRAVNATGAYNFPVGNATAAAPVNLSLNAIVGPTAITVNTLALAPSPTPNLVVGGKTISAGLNTGLWLISPDVVLSGGSYDVNIEARNYTNGVTDGSRYTVIRQAGYGGTWLADGTIGVSTQLGGTENSGVVSNGIVNVSNTGLTALPRFGYFAIGIFEPTTLPVQLTKFTAKAESNVALLNWETAAELNNDKYIVERSIDGSNFTTIGEVKGKGTVSSSSSYVFRDYTPLNANNYYRLKQLDFDGKFSYSEIRNVRFSLSNNNIAIKVYPNPVVDSFSVAGNTSAVSSVNIADLSGKKVFEVYHPASTIELPSTLINGIYIVKITFGDGTVSNHKIVINK